MHLNMHRVSLGPKRLITAGAFLEGNGRWVEPGRRYEKETQPFIFTLN